MVHAIAKKPLAKYTASKPNFREAETQTDLEPERTPAVQSIPANPPIDVETQLDDGELFDFEAEVDALVDHIVSRSIDISRVQAVEDIYIEWLKKMQEAYRIKQTTEMQTIRNLQMIEHRKQEEHDARLEQERVALVVSRSALKKARILKFAKSAFSDICVQALDITMSSDAFKMHLEVVYVPALLQKAICNFNGDRFQSTLERQFSRVKQEYVPALILDAQNLVDQDRPLHSSAAGCTIPSVAY
jgi:hypothetical protein